jgi:16S rRNA (uracil1498-N3)-methyltransferase
LRRFLIDAEQIRNGRVRLGGDEARHALYVLRLAVGDPALFVDGRGGQYAGRVIAAGQGWLEAEVVEQPAATADPVLPITLGQALIKADKMDLIVQKGTELGLTRLLPVAAERSVVKLAGPKAEARVERWRKVSRQALKQCRRASAVDVGPVCDLDAFIRQTAEADLKIVLHQDGGGAGKSVLSALAAPESVAVLVGPEGGLAAGEVEACIQAGFRPMSLGRRILRSETAALAVLAVLGFELGDLA